MAPDALDSLLVVLGVCDECVCEAFYRVHTFVGRCRRRRDCFHESSRAQRGKLTLPSVFTFGTCHETSHGFVARSGLQTVIGGLHAFAFSTLEHAVFKDHLLLDAVLGHVGIKLFEVHLAYRARIHIVGNQLVSHNLRVFQTKYGLIRLQRVNVLEHHVIPATFDVFLLAIVDGVVVYTDFDIGSDELIEHGKELIYNISSYIHVQVNDKKL